jgi:LmbE family N-acetylglucosaminyl deacetylase
MAQITSLEDIKTLGTIMGIWAHPDDETFTCGGLMAAAVQNGQQVICITATRGEQGIQDAKRWPPSKLGDIREKELTQSLKVLGVKNHHWLPYHDGACNAVSSHEAAAKIIKYIEKYQPDTILTFGPDGSTGHPDHIAVSMWVDEVHTLLANPPAVYQVADTTERYKTPFKQVDKALNYYFNLPKPNLVAEETCDICFTLPEDLCSLKCDALKVQTSQTYKMFDAFSQDKIEKAFSTETFKLAE